MKPSSNFIKPKFDNLMGQHIQNTGSNDLFVIYAAKVQDPWSDFTLYCVYKE